jgi:hypothetical protein
MDANGTLLPQATVTAQSVGLDTEPVRGQAVGDGTFFLPGLGEKALFHLQHPVLGRTSVELQGLQPHTLVAIYWSEKSAEARIVSSLAPPNATGLKAAPMIAPAPPILGWGRDPADCPPGSLFAQGPHGDDESWSFGTSDVDVNGSNLLRAESFSICGEVCDIHWWGSQLYLDPYYGWTPCTDSDPSFEIIFYDDAGGAPGSVLCSYIVQPVIVDTGILYAGFVPLLYYSVDPLPYCCAVDDGWVSIQGLGDIDCWFLWLSSPDGDGSSYFNNNGTPEEYLYDNSLCLTGNPGSGACCDDSTGDCVDDVLATDCPAGNRFACNTDCVDLTPPCGEIVACDHTIVLTDDFGDGWNGGTVDVLVNGVIVLDDLTLPTGSGPQTTVFKAATGDVISTVYVPGNWAYENEYHIYDVNGTEICSDGVGGTQPTGGACGQGWCEEDPCEGNYPPNDECTGAPLVSPPYPQVVYGSNYCAQIDCPGVLDWHSTWWEIEVPYALNKMEISFCGQGFEVNNVGIVYYDECPVDCPNYILYDGIDWYSCPDGVTAPVITWMDIPGPATVWFPVYFNYDEQVDYMLTIDVDEIVVPDNDLCENAIPVAVPSVTAGTTLGATIDYGYDCSPSGSITSPGVWYSVIGTGNMMMADLCNGATTWDTKMNVICTDCDDFQCIEGNDDYCGLQSAVEWCSQYGAQYLILVHGYGGATGDFELTVSETGGACIPEVECVPIGGCCLLDGSCIITNELYCDFVGGWYLGDGSDCGIDPLAEASLPSAAAELDWSFGASSRDRDPTCPPGSLFDQPPTSATGGWTAGVSDTRTGSGYSELIRFEDFSGGGEICDIHFWGLTLSYPWADCTEDPMTFEVIFYNDDNGAPGAVVCGPYTLVLSGIPTGEYWAGFPLYEYSAVLDPCCNIAAGWVSVQATSVGSPTDCWFLWASHGETGFGMSLLYDVDADTWTTEDFDLSLCLTGVPTTGACCDDYTGICEDDIASVDCTTRYEADTLCADLDPPCGILGACCVDLVCVATTVEADCDDMGGSWYEGEDCDAGFVCPATCEHTIAMWDSFGDGWNGCTVGVYVNGVLTKTVTLPSGAGPGYDYFDAATGDEIFLDFTCVSWCTEPTYCVYDIVGEELCCGQGGYNPGDGDITCYGNCELPEIKGACCLPDDTCVRTIEDCCEYAGGIHLGEGTGCGTGEMEAVFSEDFNGGIPDTWTVTDDAGSGLMWHDNAYWGDGNDTGGDGLCAMASSDAWGTDIFDTSLITPVMDLTDRPSAQLDLLCNYQNYAYVDYFYIDVSYDGGAWSNLLTWNEDHGSFGGPPGEAISLALEGGHLTQLRFRYYTPISYWCWWVMIDDVVVSAEAVGVSPCQDMDIKPGSCPNSFNPGSHGVLPVALTGTDVFDVTMVDISSILLWRADGVGGAVAPHEGPPGPHSVYEDVATPFDGTPCDCHELEGDGFMDLSMKFKTDELVDALELDTVPGNTMMLLILSGNMLDGTPFIAQDCIRTVPPGAYPLNLSVASSTLGAWVDIDPPDRYADGGGFAHFARNHSPGSVVTLIAEETYNGQAFYGWKVNGQLQRPRSLTLEVTVPAELISVQAVFGPPQDIVVPKKVPIQHGTGGGSAPPE